LKPEVARILEQREVDARGRLEALKQDAAKRTKELDYVGAIRILRGMPSHFKDTIAFGEIEGLVKDQENEKGKTKGLEDLEKVRLGEQKRPKEYEEHIEAYAGLVRDYDGSQVAVVASSRIKDIRQKLEDDASGKLKDLEARMEKAVTGGDYEEALFLSGSFPERFSKTEAGERSEALEYRVVKETRSAYDAVVAAVEQPETGLRAHGRAREVLAQITPFAALKSNQFADIQGLAKVKQAEFQVLVELHDRMVEVPGGTFRMGNDSSGNAAERPAYPAEVKAFLIDITEVTNQDYWEFMEAAGLSAGLSAPEHWKGGKPAGGTELLPVVKVSREEAAAFAAWSGKRLPAEAEWEFAARAGNSKNFFPWGPRWDTNREPLKGNVKPKFTAKRVLVSATSEEYNNEHPLGILHMIGNVSEWTSDTFGPYPGGKVTGKEVGTYGVARGGDFKKFVLKSYMATSREAVSPDDRRDSLGFRCVKDKR
ncbi:formylglycine-generating enzyme family protein, partial [Planctomycetota bacterium]